MNDFEARLAVRRSDSMRGKPLTREEWKAIVTGVLLPWAILILMVAFLPK